MAKHTQLELIRNLAQSRENELATEVGELRRQKTTADEALSKLDSYLAEYTLDDSGDSSKSGRSVSQVANERRFVKRLSSVVEKQRTRNRQFANHVNGKTQVWQQERAHLEALERVVEQRQVAASRIQARREQTEADALSGRALLFKTRPRES